MATAILFLSVAFIDSICKWEERNSNSRPKQAEHRAYLTHDIEWNVAVIPYTHAEVDVEHNAEDKFNGRHTHGAGHRL